MEQPAPSVATLSLSLPPPNFGHYGVFRKRKAHTEPRRTAPVVEIEEKKANVFSYFPDLYGIRPTYEWKSISSPFSKIMTIVTIGLALGYVSFTLQTFLGTPAELVQRSNFVMDHDAFFKPPLVAFSVEYAVRNETTGEKEYRFLDFENEDTYFTFEYQHSKFIEQRKGGKFTNAIVELIDCGDMVEGYFPGLFCLSPEHAHKYPLQGEWIFPIYQYLNFKLNRCIGTTPGGTPCANEMEVAKVVASSDSVQIALVVSGETYDPATGPRPVSHSWRWFAKPFYSLQHEVYLGQSIVDVPVSRWTETQDTVDLIHVSHLDSYDRPMDSPQTEYLEFFVRMDTTATQSELVYPTGSFITLVTLWGAFLNVLVNFSLGLLTRLVNNEIFKKRLKRSTKKWKDRQLKKESDQQQVVQDLKDECAPEQAPIKLHRYLPRSPCYEHPLDKLDVRLMDAEDLDAQGRFQVSPNELFHPTTVFGELRLMALKEHGRKRQAVTVLENFYLKHVAQAIRQRGLMLDESERTSIWR